MTGFDIFFFLGISIFCLVKNKQISVTCSGVFSCLPHYLLLHFLCVVNGLNCCKILFSKTHLQEILWSINKPPQWEKAQRRLARPTLQARSGKNLTQECWLVAKKAEFIWIHRGPESSICFRWKAVSVKQRATSVNWINFKFK